MKLASRSFPRDLELLGFDRSVAWLWWARSLLAAFFLGDSETENYLPASAEEHTPVTPLPALLIRLQSSARSPTSLIPRMESFRSSVL
jgi:hypothetical protein